MASTVLRDTTTWLRFFTPTGELALTASEAAETELLRMQAEWARLRGDTA